MGVQGESEVSALFDGVQGRAEVSPWSWGCRGSRNASPDRRCNGRDVAQGVPQGAARTLGKIVRPLYYRAGRSPVW